MGKPNLTSPPDTDWDLGFREICYASRVIECPYCRTTLTETTPVCPQCKLELKSAKRVLGPAPGLSHSGVTDFSGCLGESERKRLVRAVANFRDRFPQSRLVVVFRASREDFPLGAQLFWLFNSSGLASDDCKEGRNRDILVGIDTARDIAGLTIGYGLEPFLGQDALDHVMQLAVPHLQEGEYAAGVRDIIEGLNRLMEGVCRELQDMLGLEDNFAVEEQRGDY